MTTIQAFNRCRTTLLVLRSVDSPRSFLCALGVAPLFDSNRVRNTGMWLREDGVVADCVVLLASGDGAVMRREPGERRHTVRWMPSRREWDLIIAATSCGTFGHVRYNSSFEPDTLVTHLRRQPFHRNVMHRNDCVTDGNIIFWWAIRWRGKTQTPW